MTPMKQLVIKNMPEPLGKQFKAICALRGTDMRSVLLEFIEKYVKESGVAELEKRGKPK
jgi:Flp pilus assembly protein TadB